MLMINIYDFPQNLVRNLGTCKLSTLIDVTDLGAVDDAGIEFKGLQTQRSWGVFVADADTISARYHRLAH